MKTIVVNKKVIKLYDSVENMPIINFQKYNKYLLIDACIGSDINDIDNHIVKIAKFIKHNKNKESLQELQNMRQNLYMINCGISPRYLAFAALIHSVDGKEVTDLSDDGLKDLLASINTIKHSMLEGALEWIKKKVTTELETYFPGDFTSAKEKEVYSMLQRRTVLTLETIAKGADNKSQIEEIDHILLSMQRPKTFSGAESEEVKYDKQFETACIIIAQEAKLSAKSMTVLEFYSALDCLKKQTETRARMLKKK